MRRILFKLLLITTTTILLRPTTIVPRKALLSPSIRDVFKNRIHLVIAIVKIHFILSS